MGGDQASAYRLQGELPVMVDARGQSCPQPLLAMRRALREQPAGTLLCVLATDPGSWRDFHSFAELSGRPLLRAEPAGGDHRVNEVYRYWLRAGPLGSGKPNGD